MKRPRISLAISRGRGSFCEDIGNGGLAVVEYVFEFAADEEMGDVAERFEGQAVADLVFDQRAVWGEFGEGVAVDPLAVGAADLTVDKFEWRVPDRDLGPPADRKAAHFQSCSRSSVPFSISIGCGVTM